MVAAEADSERHAMAAMRGRLMAYSKGMPGGRTLRAELQKVSSVTQLEAISELHLEEVASCQLPVVGCP